MTVVCAIRDGTVILMSADKLATAENGYQIARHDSKMFMLSVSKPNDMLVGFCGTYNRFQIMRCRFVPPPLSYRNQCAWEYLVSDFVPSLRTFFRSHFTLKTADDDMERMFPADSALLIAFSGRLFSIFDDGQVEESVHEYASIGANEASLGAMFALSKTSGASVASWDILDAGMQAAYNFSSSVGKDTETIVLFR